MINKKNNSVPLKPRQTLTNIDIQNKRKNCQFIERVTSKSPAQYAFLKFADMPTVFEIASAEFLDTQTVFEIAFAEFADMPTVFEIASAKFADMQTVFEIA
jgi:hypothetical protein